MSLQSCVINREGVTMSACLSVVPSSVEPHASQCVRAKSLPLGVRELVSSPEHESRSTVAAIVRMAREGASLEALAIACDTHKQRVAKWEDSDLPDAPSLLHLVRAARTRPSVVLKIAQALVRLCEAELAWRR